jgi:hypothetical protein
MDKQTYIDGLQRIAARAMTEWSPDGITITSICAECIRARAKPEVRDTQIELAVRSIAEWFGVVYGEGTLTIETVNADEFWAEGVKLVTLKLAQ